MRKLLFLALALVMCLGLLPTTALAADYTEVVPCKYNLVGDFSEGLAAVAVEVQDGISVYNYRWGFIDKTGKEVIPCQYLYSYSQVSTAENPHFSEGLAAVIINDGTEYKVANYIGKYCFIDKTGKEVIPAKYDTASNFSEGLAKVGVKSGEKYLPMIGMWYYFTCGYIDQTGNEVIPLQYEDAKDFSEGLAAVRVGIDSSTWEWGFIDKTGKEIIPLRPYRSVSNFSEGLAAVQDQNLKWGFIDKTGNEVIPCQYTTAGDFSEGLAMVEDQNSKYGFIDRTGKVVIPLQYNHPANFSEGLAMVSNQNDGYSFIDKAGKVVIPLIRTPAGDFSEGFAVMKGGWNHYGYIDKTGNEVVPRQYSDAGSVSEGMAAVAVADGGSSWNYFKWGFISVGGAQPLVPTVGNFTDVKTGDYFAEPVKWAVEKKITAGTSATTFSPNQNCTTAQILTFLWRANGSPKPTKSNPFTDVKSGDYYAEAAAWAYEKGMVSGSTFGGNAPCTRSMAVTYMWKAAGSPNAKASSFTDVPANADYAQAVAWAVEQDITSGTGNGQFSPNSTCTRGQIVTFLYRAFAK